MSTGVEAAVSIDRLPSGNYRARVMIAGQRYTATLPTRQDAETWLLVTRARAAISELPPRVTVEQYAARWLEASEAVPGENRDVHAVNIERYVLPRLGRCQLGEVTATDIILLLNDMTRSVSAETADAVGGTCAELFDAAVADGLRARSPVRPRRARSR